MYVFTQICTHTEYTSIHKQYTMSAHTPTVHLPTFSVVKSHSQLFSRHYNLPCPQSQMWEVPYTGLIKSDLSYYDVLMAACKLSPAAVETNRGYSVGYYGSRVGCVCSSQMCSLLPRNSPCTKFLDK